MQTPFSTVVVVLIVLLRWSGQILSNKNVISADVNDMRYFFYPSGDQQVEIIYDDILSLQASNIRNGTRTIVIVGGFQSDFAASMPFNVKNAYVSLGTSNVIVLDWGRLAGSGVTYQEEPLPYNHVVKNVPLVGERLADFLYFVSSNKEIPFSEIHIVGHSLGAHVAGNAGKAVIHKYKELLGRISGLDPAGPHYNLQENPAVTLQSNDSFFVDVYHTNRGVLGIVDDIGTVNVYVNGGRSQPGCKYADVTGIIGFCSHSFAWKFFIAAFKRDYVACPCRNLTCTCTISCSHSCSDGIIVGPNMPASGQGQPKQYREYEIYSVHVEVDLLL